VPLPASANAASDATLAHLARRYADAPGRVSRLERRALTDIVAAYKAKGRLTLMERCFVQSVVEKYAERLTLPEGA
jgi:hypothetical protein